MFGKRAESLANSLTKGTKVSIDGKLRWSQWERDGQKRSKIEVIVDDVDFMGSRKQADEYRNPSTSSSGPVIDVQATVYDYDCPF